MKLSQNNNYISELSVIILYLSLGVLLTWPLVLHLNSAVFGDYGDTRGGIWWIWAGIHGLRNTPLVNLYSAPFGIDLGLIPNQPVIESLQVYLGMITGEIAAHNAFILLAFPLTAFSTYILLNTVTHDKLASFIGGLIFGFNPGAVMQAVGGHINFAFNMFIPLLLLALFHNRSKRSLLSAFSVSLCYALVTLNSLYFGYFSVFILLFFVAFDYFTLKEVPGKKFYLNYAVSALFAVILIVPFQYRMILHQLTTGTTKLAATGLVRTFDELIALSARPLEYLTPSIDHPILGRFVEHYARQHLHGSNIPEQTLYLGFIPLLATCMGFFLMSKKFEDRQLQKYFLFFTAGALWMFILSLPPFISFGGITVPTISYFTYKVAPMFRAYVRFGILVNLFVACSVAVVLAMFAQSNPKKRYYFLLLALVPILLFEYWSSPPTRAHRIDPPPKVYQWLAQEPGDIIIAEYPMMESNEASFYTYLFWQRIHKKRMVNGARPDNPEAWNFYQKVNDLSNAATPDLLRKIGAKYIIVHKHMYEEGEVPESLKRYLSPEVAAQQYNNGKTPVNPLLGKPLKVFDDVVVYALDQQVSQAGF